MNGCTYARHLGKNVIRKISLKDCFYIKLFRRSYQWMCTGEILGNELRYINFNYFLETSFSQKVNMNIVSMDVHKKNNEKYKPELQKKFLLKISFLPKTILNIVSKGVHRKVIQKVKINLKNIFPLKDHFYIKLF